MVTKLLFVHTLSPLHAGTGQGIGAIDLPIAREKATGLPYLPGSSLKGPLRDLSDEPERTAIFGPETDRASEHAGAVQFADARLLLMPVRSLAGTFAWITSPYILKRLVRDAADAGLTDCPSVTAPAPEGCFVTNGSALSLTVRGQRRVYLEDLDLTPSQTGEAERWARWIGEKLFPNDTSWQAMLAERLCIVHDDILSFLLETATEVVARIRLEDDSKTVTKGGLWYEESLPAETVLVGLLRAEPSRNGNLMSATQVVESIKTLIGKTLQLGGKATVGRGMCRLQLQEG